MEDFVHTYKEAGGMYEKMGMVFNNNTINNVGNNW